MRPDATAPVPIEAIINAPTGQVVVTFDQALVPGATSEDNWTFRANLGVGSRRFIPVEDGQLLLDQATIDTEDAGVEPGPDVVSYLAAPVDIFGLVGGLPAAAFADFPLTVVG